ncbi:ABC transporter ATP-binding protein [Sporanaerobacter acetigenes]|uniref:ABC transporter ATP-binding protein n=1 Tax=Sporanaerobacter acetigenes TaxID=165813 RepID=UPI00331DD558
MLKINNLTLYYGMVKALNSITLNINQKGICSIVGANGAGKSSLLRTIMGINKPQTGEIVFEGEHIENSETFKIVKRGIILCPEGRRIFKGATVFENLQSGALSCKDKDRVVANYDKVFSLFPKLKERANQIAGTLSGGEQQMLAIGRGLMAEPRLFLLDEPSMGLAPNLVDLVFDTIEYIYNEENIPVLLVEQNAEMALEIAHYAYVLEVGNIVLEGTGRDLLESDEVKAKYLGT